MSLVVNPTGESNYFGTNGAVLTSQPTTDTTRIGSPSKNTDVATGLNSDNVVEESAAFESTYPFTGTSASVTRENVDDSVSNSNGNTTIAFDSQNQSLVALDLKEGDFVYTNIGLIARVFEDAASDELTLVGENQIQQPVQGDPYFWAMPEDLVKQVRDGNYAGVGLTKSLNGVANLGIAGGANDGPVRGANTREKVRTSRVTTAIRAGNWNEYSGVWTSEPAVADDTTALGVTSDNSTTTGSRTTFAYGRTPETK